MIFSKILPGSANSEMGLQSLGFLLPMLVFGIEVTRLTPQHVGNIPNCRQLLYIYVSSGTIISKASFSSRVLRPSIAEDFEMLISFIRLCASFSFIHRKENIVSTSILHLSLSQFI